MELRNNIIREIRMGLSIHSTDARIERVADKIVAIVECERNACMDRSAEIGGRLIDDVLKKIAAMGDSDEPTSLQKMQETPAPAE